MLFVANVDEGSEEVPGGVAAHAAAQGAARGRDLLADRVRARPSSRTTDAAAMRAELGVSRARPLQRVVREAFALLELIAFFTAGEAKPAQSWHLRRGLTAWHAAGEIHSDIQKGLRARRGDRLARAGRRGRLRGARDRGTLRLEGRDYVMADGDVITVKFTP